jgi:hypothetical protein
MTDGGRRRAPAPQQGAPHHSPGLGTHTCTGACSAFRARLRPRRRGAGRSRAHAALVRDPAFLGAAAQAGLRAGPRLVAICRRAAYEAYLADPERADHRARLEGVALTQRLLEVVDVGDVRPGLPGGS